MSKPRIKQVSDTSNSGAQIGLVGWQIFDTIDGSVLKTGSIAIVIPLTLAEFRKVVRVQMMHEIFTYVSENDVWENDTSLPSLAGSSSSLRYSAVLDFPEIVTGTGCDDLTIAAPGAEVGDTVSLAVPANIPARSIFFAWVSAANVVTVRHAAHGGSPNPASGTYTVEVHK